MVYVLGLLWESIQIFVQCWPTVYDGGPALRKHLINVSCLLGRSSLVRSFLAWLPGHAKRSVSCGIRAIVAVTLTLYALHTRFTLCWARYHDPRVGRRCFWWQGDIGVVSHIIGFPWVKVQTDLTHGQIQKVVQDVGFRPDEPAVWTHAQNTQRAQCIYLQQKIPANTRRPLKVDLMLGQSCRRWASIQSTLDQCLV